MEVPPLEPMFTIKDLKTLRLIADPLHIQIFEALVIDKPLTIKQVAERLGLAPSKLYYHFDLMEKHGLIRIVETRTVANMIEKLYQAVAKDLEVDPTLLSFATEENKEALENLIVSALDGAREDLLRSLQARRAALNSGATEKPRKIMVTRKLARLTEAQADSFRARLCAFMKEFDDQLAPDDPDQDSQAYSMFVALYPSYYYPEEKRE